MFPCLPLTSIAWLDLLPLKLHKRYLKLGGSYKQNGNILIRATQSMAKGPGEGREFKWLVRIEEVQDVALAVP